MLQFRGGRWYRNPAAERRICGRSRAQYATRNRLQLFSKKRLKTAGFYTIISTVGDLLCAGKELL